MWIISVCLILSMSSAFATDVQQFRHFQANFNPGCSDPICSRVSPTRNPDGTFQQLPNILYLFGTLATTENGVNDTLHVVFSTFGGFPTMLVVHCNDSNEQLSFNWNVLLNDTSAKLGGGMNFPKNCANPYSFALVAVSIVDFNDPSDAMQLSSTSPNETYVVPFSKLAWMRMTNTSDPNIIQVQADPILNGGTYFTNNGTCRFLLAVSSVVGLRPSDLPHLEFSGNSVQLHSLFDHWLSQFSNTRLAVELLLVAHNPSAIRVKSKTAMPSSEALLYSTRSIDDEYTPGTFTLDNWITRGSQYDALQVAAPENLDIANGYVQYKPIAYTNPNEYTVQNTVTVSTSSLDKNATHLLAMKRFRDAVENTLVAALYEEPAESVTNSIAYSLSAVNVSFGQMGDGFYRHTSWLKWTMQVGFGAPPQDAVSSLVIVIILVGLGFPIVLITAGGVYYCVRKLRGNRMGYQRIN